ncbi:hypothetical protein, partial [Chitinimonas sp.]|uniref:ATP-grasp domain-containing protein n=1 Tax=Chitinimonas sp. TaxID=1934313 RepID=UPI002F926943
MKGPILFVGVADESPLAMAIAAAKRLGLPQLIIDQRQLTGQDVEIGIRRGQCFARWWSGSSEFDLTTCTGAYTRAIPASLVRDKAGGPHGVLHDHYFVDALNAWLEVAPLRVANRLAAGCSNGAKTWQAQQILAAGFNIPPSLISNDPDEVLAFRRQHRRLVFKSASGLRSIVTPLEGEHEARLDRIRVLPTLFQAYIPGVNYRVHVVDKQAFCTRIDSRATDYRYAEREGCAAGMEADRLPDEVAQRCIRLAQRLGLVMAGIDL